MAAATTRFTLITAARLLENYLGFPMGISGQDLAGRALLQAEKFGASLAVARVAVALACADRRLRVTCADGRAVQGNAEARGVRGGRGLGRGPACPQGRGRMMADL